MKKTVTVNLNGRIFTMDEDAYHLLDSYLNNLRIYFEREEGASEITADFEAGIEELLSGKLRSGYTVIAVAQVEEVIARMGKPADFETTGDAGEAKRASAPETKEVRKKLFRNMQNKSIAGVCSGIAARFGWDPVWLRLAFVALFFVTHGFLLMAYLIAWMIIPAARTAEEKLQMRGEPITLENIGKTVAGQGAPQRTTNNGCLAGFLDVIAGLTKICLVGLGCLIALPLLFVLAIVIIVLVAVLFGVGGGLLGGLLPAASALTFGHPALASISFAILAGIPLAALIYWGIARIAKLKPMDRSIKRACLIVWLAALALFLCSGIRIDRSFIFAPWRGGDWPLGAVFSHSDKRIVGNGIPSEKDFVIPEPVDEIRTGNRLTAHLQIEQTASDTTTLLLSGDENLIANLKYEIKDRRLRLFADRTVARKNNLLIRVRTPNLRKVELHSAGNISFPDTFAVDNFEIKTEGAGKVRMTYLETSALTVDADGVGSVDLAGKAGHVKLELDGVGGIDALQLVADTVYAHLDGVGSIRCNPTIYLKARSSGIGSITYKNEPAHKDVHSSGIGKIGRD
jgi:phage shock protein PspC (stress-responsive transcriptional regulator)